MHPPTILSFVATLLIAWLPGGLIHRGAQQVNAKAEAPVANLIETVRSNTAAMVQR